MATMMRDSNRFRKAVIEGKGPSFGAWQWLPGAHLSRAMARSGFDWIAIDCEHGNITDNEMHDSIHAIASTGASPVVRILANQDWMVKRALDGGAHAIMVPQLRSVAEAERLVASAKFPPMGRRGFGSPFSMGAFSNQGNLSALEYLNAANDNLITIAQIETKEAFECVEDIARVQGIDVLFIGPWDLGNSLGYPVEGEFPSELRRAIARIQRAAASAGKRAGIFCPSGESARHYAAEGFQMISVASDVTALTAFLAESLSTARGVSADASMKAGKDAAYVTVNSASSATSQR